MAIDVDWSLLELEKFIGLTVTDTRNTEVGRYRTRRGSQDDILAAAVVVEKICDRVISDWRTSIETRGRRVDRWDELVEAAKRTKVILERRAEVDEKLGEGAPQLDAAQFHPWVWEGARSLWQSGHFRDAVRAASIKVNAETQNKIQRRNVSEGDLFKQAFSSNEPKLGEPRLRIISNDGSKDFENVHRGARDFASGLYTAIRNPMSHNEGELPENEALEQLAAFSVLARWVDAAQFDEAP